MASKETCCAVCGVFHNLSVHHIHPREFKDTYPGGPENIDEEANLAILCQGCHAAVHSSKPFSKLLRDLKVRAKRKAKSKITIVDSASAQSARDQKIQQELWKRLIIVLQNIEYCKKLEAYRLIIQKIYHVNSVWFIESGETTAA